MSRRCYFASIKISLVRANPRGFSSLLAGAWGVTRGATAPSRRSRERVPLHAGERRPDLRSGVMLRGRKPPRPGRSCPPGGQPCAFAPPLRWPWRRSRVRARRPRAVAYATVCSTPCCSSTPPPVLVSAACDIGRTAARGVIVGVVLPSCDASLPGSPAARHLGNAVATSSRPLGAQGLQQAFKTSGFAYARAVAGTLCARPLPTVAKLSDPLENTRIPVWMLLALGCAAAYRP